MFIVRYFGCRSKVFRRRRCAPAVEPRPGDAFREERNCVCHQGRDSVEKLPSNAIRVRVTLVVRLGEAASGFSVSLVLSCLVLSCQILRFDVKLNFTFLRTIKFYVSTQNLRFDTKQM